MLQTDILLYSTDGSILNQGFWENGIYVGSAPVQHVAEANPTIQSSVYAQSQLHACQGSTRNWTNCSGTSWSNGLKYVGEWQYGRYNGKGALYSSDGSILNQGFWVDDRFVGSSPVRQANTPSQPTIYEQSQLAPCQGQSRWEWNNCSGSITYPSNDKYVGEFKFGKSNGKGVYTYANGSRYVGEFKDDKNNGQGTFYAPNGSILNQGIWVDDRFVGSASVQQVTNRAV